MSKAVVRLGVGPNLHTGSLAAGLRPLALVLLAAGIASAKTILLVGDSRVNSPSDGYAPYVKTALSSVATVVAKDEDNLGNVNGVPKEPSILYLLNDFDSRVVSVKADIFMYSPGVQNVYFFDSLTEEQRTARFTRMRELCVKVFQTARAKMPRAVILGATCLPMDASHACVSSTVCKRRNIYVVQLNDMFKAACAAQSVPLCDVYKFTIDNNLRRIDGRHYDLAGKKAQADYVVKFLKSYLTTPAAKLAALERSPASRASAQFRVVLLSGSSVLQQKAHTWSATPDGLRRPALAGEAR